MGCPVVRTVFLVYMGAGEMRHPRRYAIGFLAEIQEVTTKGARSYQRPAEYGSRKTIVPVRGQDSSVLRPTPPDGTVGNAALLPLVAQSRMTALLDFKVRCRLRPASTTGR